METTYRAKCPDCGKFHDIDGVDFALFGRDAQCMRCVDWNHVKFMHTTGNQQKLTCVTGCRCGMG